MVSKNKITCSKKTVSFVVPGQPVAKARARIFRTKNGVRAVTPDKTRAYEKEVAWRAAEAMAGLERMECPVRVSIDLHMKIPESWSKVRRLAALSGEIGMTTKPDLSNVLKGIEDAMNGIVYLDDSQIIEAVVRKLYGDYPRANITVVEADGRGSQGN